MTPQQAADALCTPQLVGLRQQFQQAGHDLRFVGGCVRDSLLGAQPHDVDLHTDATPEEQVHIYQQLGVHHIPTGMDHGTITVVLEGDTYEITSLRLDVATDGRRATVAYTRDWLADLDRRDFTFNSMSLGFDGDLMDPHDGLRDLEAGVVRFVGVAQDRVREDALRILRWFRFRARFGMRPDNEALEACCVHGRLLSYISVERIWSELRQMLEGPRALEVMCDLHMTGVRAHCGLPAMDWMSTLMTTEHNSYAQEVFARSSNAVTRLWSLHHSNTHSMLVDFKCSGAELMLCDSLDRWVVHQDHNPATLLATGVLTREHALEVAAARLWEPLEMAVLETWQPPTFPVTGADLIAEGFKPGPSFTVILGELKLLWARTNYEMNKRQLLDSIEPCWV